MNTSSITLTCKVAFAMVLSAGLMLLALPPIGVAAAGFLIAVPLIRLPTAVSNVLLLAIGPLTGLLAAQVASFPLLPTANDATPGWTVLGLTAFGALIGLFSALARSTEGRQPLGIIGCLILVEWATAAALPMHLGLTQYRSGVMLLLASFGGIWLVSALVWWGNLALAQEVRRWPLWLGAAPLLFLPPLPDSGSLPVAVLQTNSLDSTELASLHRKASAESDLVVWPELSATDWVAEDGRDVPRLLSVNLAAFVTTFPDQAEPLPHNVAAFFSQGRELAHYEKRKPFAGEVNVHAAGNRVVVAPWRETQIGLNICFDSCYPWIMRDTARAGAAVIVLPSLDPITPNGWIAGIHEAYGRFRAAELGVSILRAEANHASSIVTRMGAVQAIAGAESPAVVRGRVATHPRFTVYKALGDWMLWLSVGVVLWSVFGNRLRPPIRVRHR
ncbi:MAG: hypothetical protein JNM85_08270 [Chthonomonas sp.]|nr:hypothetical protein [Chthonomonas sp.]